MNFFGRKNAKKTVDDSPVSAPPEQSEERANSEADKTKSARKDALLASLTETLSVRKEGGSFAPKLPVESNKEQPGEQPIEQAMVAAKAAKRDAKEECSITTPAYQEEMAFFGFLSRYGCLGDRHLPGIFAAQAVPDHLQKIVQVVALRSGERVYLHSKDSLSW